jgi:hypothetical protein
VVVELLKICSLMSHNGGYLDQGFLKLGIDSSVTQPEPFELELRNPQLDRIPTAVSALAKRKM